MKSLQRLHWLSMYAGLALMLGAGHAAAQKTQLNVYTALETDQIKAYEAAFNKAYPDVELKFTRDSTGVITAKVLAEKANPQADIVIGTSASSMAVFAQEGMLEPYAPKGLDKIPAAYRDSQNPPRWVGMDVYGAAICFNTVEAQKQNLPKPAIVEGPDEARLQGQDRDAEPGVVGHRLPRRRGLAPDVGRGGRMEVHGRAAREHRRVHALGFAAVQAGRRRRVSDRRFVRVSRDGDEEVGRAGRHHLSERRPGMGSRGERHHEGHEETGRREEADGLACDAGRDEALRRTISRSSRCPACRSRSSSFPSTTRSG